MPGDKVLPNEAESSNNSPAQNAHPILHKSCHLKIPQKYKSSMLILTCLLQCGHVMAMGYRPSMALENDGCGC